MTDHEHHTNDHEQFKDELDRRSRRRFRVLAGGMLALTLALNVAPVAANHLNVKTSDIQNGAVTTPKLRDDAVKTGKINDGAVTRSKIRNRAVGTNKIALEAEGVALAGVRINPDGTRLNWFNRFGGAPTVTRVNPGLYNVTFPGLEGRLGVGAFVLSNVDFAIDGTVRQMSSNVNSVTVAVRGGDGTPVDRTVTLVVMAPST